MTFDEAIADSENFEIPETAKTPESAKKHEASGSPKPSRERHLLLGNGFSIAYDPIFDYRSLFGWANFSKRPELREIFKKKKTQDFERVIRILLNALEVLKVYNKDSLDAIAMRRDAKDLKKILIDTIVDIHPPDPKADDHKQLVDCRKFLRHFLKKGDNDDGGEIYTLNYDFLLYWACMHKGEYLGNDGFSNGGDKPLTWSRKNLQTVHYLHGALHFSYDGSKLYKLSSKKEDPLLVQVQKRRLSKKLPLFVAEGTSKKKFEKIEKNAYLHYCYNSFLQKMKQPNDVLFIFGHSLDNKSDKHILDCIIEGKISRVYVSLYRDPKSGYDPNIRKNAEEWESLRATHYPSGEYPLEVKFFDAESANIWGK